MKSEFKFAVALAQALACVALVGCGGAGEEEVTTDAAAQVQSADSAAQDGNVQIAGDGTLSAEDVTEQSALSEDFGEMRQAMAATTATTSWAQVANEWKFFTLTKSSTVRFGSGSKWVQRTLAAGKAYCGVSTFGSDPAPGTSNVCQVASTTTTTTPTPTTGKAVLAWAAPTKNADGSSLSDLAGYKIYYGTTKGTYSKSITISSPYTTNYTISGLPVGTTYIIVKAYDTSNNMSVASAELSKTIK
jgi:hypothetical protein